MKTFNCPSGNFQISEKLHKGFSIFKSEEMCWDDAKIVAEKLGTGWRLLFFYEFEILRNESSILNDYGDSVFWTLTEDEENNQCAYIYDTSAEAILSGVWNKNDKWNVLAIKPI
jgi:hypothetical protein